MVMIVLMMAGGNPEATIQSWARTEPAARILRRRAGAHADARDGVNAERREKANGWPARLGDALLLTSVLILAAATLAAVAVVAPLVLAASALVGLVARSGAPKAWRAVRAR